MPPRITTVNEAGTGFRAWYESVPPITRYMATGMVGLTLAGNFGLISPVYMALLWTPILKKFEIWRLVTCFMFMGKLSFNFLIRMLWVFQYSAPLESQMYQFEPADYMFFLLFSGALCLVAGYIFGFLILGVPLIMAIIYVWSRNFPDQQVSLYGLVKIQSFYMPFAFAAISLLMGQSIIPDATGIVVGHIYWFLKEIYPRQSGRQLLHTPSFLKQWMADAGLRGVAPPPREATGAPQGFSAFRGSGRRLGQD